MLKISNKNNHMYITTYNYLHSLIFARYVLHTIMPFKINSILLPMKGHFFLWNAAIAPILCFMPIYANHLGFSGFVVGIIYATLPLATFLIKPLIGIIADKFRCRKIIFLVIQSLSILAMFSLFFLPSVPADSKALVELTCYNSKVVLHYCDVKDWCAIERLKSNGPDYKILCLLNCSLQSINGETICKYWNGNDYCKTHQENFSLAVNISIYQIFEREKCLNFEISNITLEKGKTCNATPNISSTCDIKCDSQEINNILTKTTFNSNNIFMKHEFWYLLIVYMLIWMCDDVTITMANIVCFHLLGDAPHKYGMQRMFGTLGWGMSTILDGLLVDYFSMDDTRKNYTPVFGTGIGIALFSILVSSKIRHIEVHTTTTILRDVVHIVSNIRTIIFGLCCIFVAITMTARWNYLFWLLDELAANQGCGTMSWIKTIEGLAIGIQCLGGELPCYFLSGWILRRFRHVHTMSIVLLLIGITYTSYSSLSNPWMVLPIELCAGVTNALYYATLFSYANSIAPPASAATIQCIAGALVNGGISIGGILGGTLFHQYGSAKTFEILGVVGFVGCVLHVVVQVIIGTASKNVGTIKYATPENAVTTLNEDG